MTPPALALHALRQEFPRLTWQAGYGLRATIEGSVTGPTMIHSVVRVYALPVTEESRWLAEVDGCECRDVEVTEAVRGALHDARAMLAELSAPHDGGSAGRWSR